MFFHRIGRRAILGGLLGLLLPVLMSAQSLHRSEQRGARFDHLDETEAMEFLELFRSSTLSAGHIFDFSLRVMPRRGAETHYQGRLWTTPLEEAISGSIIELAEADQSPMLRLLFFNGPEAPASIWQSDFEIASEESGFGPSRELSGKDRFVPLSGSDYAPFDLQMPFLFWADTSYDGRYFLRGRSTYTFIARPAEEDFPEGLDFTHLRLHFDAEFAALMQVDWLDRRDREVKTLALLEIKEVADQWLPKTLDLRHHGSRGKTRFTVLEAALNLLLPGELFTPDALSRELPEVDPDLFHRVN